MAINFKASFVADGQVLKLDSKTNKYEPKGVNFVKLSPTDTLDLKTTSRVAKDWDHWIAYNVYDGLYYNVDSLDTYALTEQTKNLKKLDSNKILGLAQIRKNNNKERNLEYLIVKPDYEAENLDIRKFKKVGTEILNCIKRIFPKDTIKVGSLPSVINFYKKNGFKEGSTYSCILSWKNLIKK